MILALPLIFPNHLVDHLQEVYPYGPHITWWIGRPSTMMWRDKDIFHIDQPTLWYSCFQHKSKYAEMQLADNYRNTQQDEVLEERESPAYSQRCPAAHPAAGRAWPSATVIPSKPKCWKSGNRPLPEMPSETSGWKSRNRPLTLEALALVKRDGEWQLRGQWHFCR